MLQYSAVNKGTLGLLKSMMTQDSLSGFYLVGGTALALQIGHRISLDLDFFSETDFNPSEIRNNLEQVYNIKVVSENKGGLNLMIEFPQHSGNIVKVDIVKYRYPMLKPVVITDGIRFLSKEDIIPMKLAAISNRGARKDFYDLFFLLQEFSLKEMMILFEKKYSNDNNFYVIKSITYFDDAENEADPVLLKKISWEKVKEFIRKKSAEYIS